ncbi:MAG: hypothetical protein K8R99_09985 [Actinomycetia bacterium]|nr:hypothetical protein [Actinomycetes bacterium]
MEIDQLFGLPAHPLLVHLPVIVVPVAALLAVVFAFRPAWLDRFGWGLVVLSGVGALGAILAAGSGEALEENVKRTSALEDHIEMGDVAQTVAIIFFFVVLAVVVLRYFARKKTETAGVWAMISSKAGAIVIAAALVLSASGAMYTIVQAGHQGAKATWETKR